MHVNSMPNFTFLSPSLILQIYLRLLSWKFLYSSGGDPSNFFPSLSTALKSNNKRHLQLRKLQKQSGPHQSCYVRKEIIRKG